MTKTQANHLVRQVEAALKLNSGAAGGAKLAEEFAALMRLLNVRLSQCSAILQQSNDLAQTIQFAESEPPLLDIAAELNPSTLAAWAARCQEAGWAAPEALDERAVHILNAAYARTEPERPALWASLYREYRAGVLLHDSQLACTALRSLRRAGAERALISPELLRLERILQEPMLTKLPDLLGTADPSALIQVVEQIREMENPPADTPEWREAVVRYLDHRKEQLAADAEPLLQAGDDALRHRDFAVVQIMLSNVRALASSAPVEVSGELDERSFGWQSAIDAHGTAVTRKKRFRIAGWICGGLLAAVLVALIIVAIVQYPDRVAVLQKATSERRLVDAAEAARTLRNPLLRVAAVFHPRLRVGVDADFRAVTEEDARRTALQEATELLRGRFAQAQPANIDALPALAEASTGWREKFDALSQQSRIRLPEKDLALGKAAADLTAGTRAAASKDFSEVVSVFERTLTDAARLRSTSEIQAYKQTLAAGMAKLSDPAVRIIAKVIGGDASDRSKSLSERFSEVHAAAEGWEPLLQSLALTRDPAQYRNLLNQLAASNFTEAAKPFASVARFDAAHICEQMFVLSWLTAPGHGFLSTDAGLTRTVPTPAEIDALNEVGGSRSVRGVWNATVRKFRDGIEIPDQSRSIYSWGAPTLEEITMSDGKLGRTWSGKVFQGAQSDMDSGFRVTRISSAVFTISKGKSIPVSGEEVDNARETKESIAFARLDLLRLAREPGIGNIGQGPMLLDEIVQMRDVSSVSRVWAERSVHKALSARGREWGFFLSPSAAADIAWLQLRFGDQIRPSDWMDPVRASYYGPDAEAWVRRVNGRTYAAEAKYMKSLFEQIRRNPPILAGWIGADGEPLFVGNAAGPAKIYGYLTDGKAGPVAERANDGGIQWISNATRAPWSPLYVFPIPLAEMAQKAARDTGVTFFDAPTSELPPIVQELPPFRRAAPAQATSVR